MLAGGGVLDVVTACVVVEGVVTVIVVLQEFLTISLGLQTSFGCGWPVLAVREV